MTRRGLSMVLLSPVLLCWLGSAALSAPAPAEPAKDLPIPKGAPPHLTLARMTKEGDLVTLAIVPVIEKRQVTVEIIIGGKRVPEQREITVTAYQTVEQTFKVKGLRASHVNGTKVDPKKLPALLARRTLVLISHGDAIDPIYLRAFKDNLLILSLRPAGALDGGRPRPPVAPPR